MNNIEFVNKLKEVATKYKTLYVLGCFGWPLNEEKKKRAKNAQSYNREAERAAKINAATSDTFGFDCVNLLKALLWGWNGNVNANYGGAKYASNGVPDIDESVMFRKCAGISTDFSNIQVGEAVWMTGHIGVYIGDGLAVECTPRWKDGVQITAVHNIGTKAGYNGRKWTKHGKLPYIEYVKESKPAAAVSGTASTGSAADEKAIWNFLKGKGLNDYAVAGLMGNLYAESALRSNNLQGSYERKLGYTDATYTKAVDNGSYDNFVKDSAGYGLAQWTYHTRKQALLDFARAAKKSIADLNTQLEFLWKELQSYTAVMKVLKSAKSVKEASDIVLVKYESPADQSAAVKAKRAGYGQAYYNKYAKKAAAPAATTIKKGDVVSIAAGAVWYTGKAIPAWVKKMKWIVRDVNGARAVIDKSADGSNAICSPINVKFLKKV